MKRFTHNMAVKSIAVLLFILFSFGFVSGAFGIVYLSANHFYDWPVDSVRELMFDKITRSFADRVFHEYFPAYQEKRYSQKSIESAFSADKTNFRFTLKNEEGETVLGNYAGEEVQFSLTLYYDLHGGFLYYDEDGRPVFDETETYTMECHVVEVLTAYDTYSKAEYWVSYAYSMRYALIAITASFLLLSILLFVFLMCAAGRRSGRTEVVLSGIDKIPYEALLTGLLVTGFILIRMLYELCVSMTYGNTAVELGLACVSALICILLILLACMSFARRYKHGEWWKNTIIFRLLRFIHKTLRKALYDIKLLLVHLPLLWQAILGLLLFSVAELIVIVCTIPYNVGIVLFFWLLEKLIIVPAAMYAVLSLKKLRICSQRIADGDLDYRIDTRHLFWEFKQHGENLNNISVGMSKAVEARMKSERFRTELITNVSHDIKTPLTSIINYVSLIKREEIKDERLMEYVTVLDRQSSRLKKLIDDLIEASKASTGSLPVNSAPTEVGLLLTQAVGEYEERMRENGLELILTRPEEVVFIMADGRLLWRVFDNLLSNICKYSQPDTRAYLSLEQAGEHAVITFRNISRYMLNISSEELLKRFVRGDSARSTEGSGLGLSIARSLVELQKGKLDLIIDGDLFKVVLTFPIVK